MPEILRSHLAGRWIGETAATPLAHAVTGDVVAFTHAEQPDFGAALAQLQGGAHAPTNLTHNRPWP